MEETKQNPSAEESVKLKELEAKQNEVIEDVKKLEEKHGIKFYAQIHFIPAPQKDESNK